MLKPFLEYLDESVVVCDGAMGTQLYSKGVFLNRCFDELNLGPPSLVRDVHQEYMLAGADILETNTFGANPSSSWNSGLAERVRDINVAGVRIAREVAGASAYVGGSVGPLGIRIEPYGKMAVDEARAIFVEQITALVEAGVDLLCLETFFDLNEIHAAILAAREVCDLPIMAQLTLEEDGNSLDGSPPETFGRQLQIWGPDLIGANCGVGPQVMLDSMERMAAVVTRRLVAQPNAGKPRFQGTKPLPLVSGIHNQLRPAIHPGRCSDCRGMLRHNTGTHQIDSQRRPGAAAGSRQDYCRSSDRHPTAGRGDSDRTAQPAGPAHSSE